MNGRWSHAAVVALGVAGAWTAGGRAQQAVFRATTDVVSVDVSVTKGRNPVTGLTARDFVLLDNGVRQDVEIVSLPTRPIDVTLVFAGALDSQVSKLARGAWQLSQLRGMLQPTDRCRIISAGSEVRELAPMALVGDSAKPIPEIVRSRGVSLNDALFYALAWPTDPERRHLVVVFTNGFDTRDSTIESGLVPEIAGRADAVLYESPPSALPTKVSSSGASASAVDVTASWTTWSTGGNHGLLDVWRESYRALDQAVQRTGGTLRHITKDVDGFQQVLDEKATGSGHDS